MSTVLFYLYRLLLRQTANLTVLQLRTIIAILKVSRKQVKNNDDDDVNDNDTDSP